MFSECKWWSNAVCISPEKEKISGSDKRIDASRFLAQSQSRIQPTPGDTPRHNGDRQRRSNQGTSRFALSRSYLQRAVGNPYQSAASQISQFPFASRNLKQPAPLFFSTTDEFREEDDEQEREREIADYYALQRSRRHFSSGHLQDSSEIGDEEQLSGASETSASGQENGHGQRHGIRSSWRDDRPAASQWKNPEDGIKQHRDRVRKGPHNSMSSISGKGKMVDVGLDDTPATQLDDIDEDDPPPEFVEDNDAPVQQFRKNPDYRAAGIVSSSSFIPQETDDHASSNHRPPSLSSSSPHSITEQEARTGAHDAFWGHLFVLSLSGLFATAFLVYLQTSLPGRGSWRWGDTIYNTIHKSYFLLGTYTLVALGASLSWLVLLRNYVRWLVLGSLVCVPVILYSFSIYAFVSSFKGGPNEATVQDRVMRWTAALPSVFASFWIYFAIQNRHATAKAINILDFTCRILAVNPGLVAFGLIIVTGIVTWTWIWMLMFTRLFLGGHLSTNSFVVSIGTWWLGVYFVLVYLWSIGVLGGIQRSVTAATVSQWYFHRSVIPAPTSIQVLKAALTHALTTLFGTICLSTCLALLLRLPLLLLPRRLSGLITLCAYSLIPTPILSLTNPLSLTYAAIHSQPLSASARALSQIATLSSMASNSPMYYQPFPTKYRNSAPLASYRLSKLILHASRLVMSLVLGFGGWITAARNLQVLDGSKKQGSLYAYVVGLIGGAIGWAVLGAMESILACIVDAALVCWASEIGNEDREARYCREADLLFGSDLATPQRYDRGGDRV